MSSYDTLVEFGSTQEFPPDVLTVNPYWIVAVLRQKYPTTFNRGVIGQKADQADRNASFSTSYADAVAVRGKTLIITDDCINLHTTATKASHLSQMQATLLPGQNYLAEVMPGDPIFVWMMHDRSTYDDVLKRLRNGEACNRFLDGFKFMGKVSSIRKQLIQAGEGQRYVRYSLSGVGFSEFDASVFYDPYLAAKVPAIGAVFAKQGLNINKLVRATGSNGKVVGIDTGTGIISYLDLLLGKGIPQSLSIANQDPRLRSTAGLDAGEYSYIHAKEAGAIIGKTTTSKSVLNAADMLEVVYGVQQYSNTGSSETLVTDDLQKFDDHTAGRIFNPDNTLGEGSRRWTGTDMLGIYLPMPTHFTNQTVWSILQQYLNPAINEMYTALRVNGQGRVVPTLVVRQLPFSSERLKTSISVTRYLDLPRWKVHETLIRGADLGRSDALRINFVHVYGTSEAKDVAPVAGQIVRNPPFRDDLDIARSGLRSHMSSIPCAPEDTRNGSATKWMTVLSDTLMGQHLTLTGTMSLVGLQAPICPGDNLEWDGVVYHIESVDNSCNISADGRKSFTTQLCLTHGMNADPTGFDDLDLYAGVKPTDQTTFDPGLTVETTQDSASDPTSLVQPPAVNADDLLGEGKV